LKELDAFNVVKGGNLIHIVAFNSVSFTLHKAFPLMQVSGNVRSILICETMGMSDATKIGSSAHLVMDELTCEEDVIYYKGTRLS